VFSKASSILLFCLKSLSVSLVYTETPDTHTLVHKHTHTHTHTHTYMHIFKTHIQVYFYAQANTSTYTACTQHAYTHKCSQTQLYMHTVCVNCEDQCGWLIIREKGQVRDFKSEQGTWIYYSKWKKSKPQWVLNGEVRYTDIIFKVPWCLQWRFF
jgi:hypothetical protein